MVTNLLDFKQILMLLAVLCFTRFVFRFLIRPYYFLMKLKKTKGGQFNYTPIVGFVLESKNDFLLHNDAFYTTKKRSGKNQDVRFAASPFMDQITIALLDPELIKEFASKQTKSFVKDSRLIGVM